MILVAAPDGTVNATDRALWLTVPFNGVWGTLVIPVTPACRLFSVPASDRAYHVPGATALMRWRVGSSNLFLKDANAVLDYRIDWSAWLGVDTIASTTWTVPTGITQDSATNTTTTATIWLSGGTAGTAYTLTNRIVTAAGRTQDQSITILVIDR